MLVLQHHSAHKVKAQPHDKAAWGLALASTSRTLTRPLAPTQRAWPFKAREDASCCLQMRRGVAQLAAAAENDRRK